MIGPLVAIYDVGYVAFFQFAIQWEMLLSVILRFTDSVKKRSRKP